MNEAELVKEIEKHARLAGLTPEEFVSEAGKCVAQAESNIKKMAEDFFSQQTKIRTNAAKLREKMAHGARRTRGPLKFPV